MFLFPIRKKEFEVLYTYEHILQKIAFSQGPTYHRVCYVYDKHNVQYPKSKQTKKSERQFTSNVFTSAGTKPANYSI